MSSAASTVRAPVALIKAEWLPIFGGLLLLYGATFWDLSHTLWQVDDYAHGPIILALIGWIFWQRRNALLDAAEDVARAPGYILLSIGALIYALGRSQDIILFEVGSLLPVLAGVILITRGWAAVRALWFPLLFIAFLIPLPGLFVDALTTPLKQSISAIAESLLYVAGYPIARNGVVLMVGSYQLLVADACSGLNSMFSLSALGLMYLYLMKYRSRLHIGLVLASILPIAFCANIVRVMILVLITYHFGDEVGQGMAHGFAGMTLFTIALVMLLTFDAGLRRIFSGSDERRPS